MSSMDRPTASSHGDPILICGVGRSGTSLLQSMLHAHPEVVFPPETHFFRRYLAKGAVRAKLEAEGPMAFVDRLTADEDFARADVDAGALVERTVRATSHGFDLLEVFRSFLATIAEREGVERVGDKDPRNIDHLPALRRAFPRAHVIHVIRDPRDVLLSRTKAAWSASRPWWIHPMIYREQLARGRRHGLRHFGKRYLELRYEDLITEPEAELRRICDHVGIDYDPRMLDFGQAARGLVDEREMSWKRETLGPLLPKNAGKWRKALNATQIRWTERLCSRALRNHGYIPATLATPPSLREWIALGVAPLLALGASLGYAAKLRMGTPLPDPDASSNERPGGATPTQPTADRGPRPSSTDTSTGTSTDTSTGASTSDGKEAA